MLFLVARQQSTPMNSLTRNYITGFLWVRAVTIAMQRFGKRTLNNGATVFREVRVEGISWRPALQSSCIGDSDGKFVREEELKYSSDNETE
jgi:hypothetical protein